MTGITGINVSPSLLSAPEATAKTGKIQDAAQQFEALLIGQMLRSARENEGGWLGSEDSTSDSATEFAEQQLATVMAKSGGLGLATMIGKGLAAASQPATSPAAGASPR